MSRTVENLKAYAESHRYFCEIEGVDVFMAPGLDEASAFANWLEGRALALDLSSDEELRYVIAGGGYWRAYAERVLFDRIARGVAEPVVESPCMLPRAYYGEIIPFAKAC